MSAIGLHPGSALPRTADEMDRLLRRVPEVAFQPEVRAHLFSAEALGAVAALGPPARIDRLADATFVGALRTSLADLSARAELEHNGGLQFLARTLAHFLGTIPSGEHPLLVALYCRSVARAAGRGDTPPEIGVAMDEYEAAHGA